jgi:predicted phosphodiesterase
MRIVAISDTHEQHAQVVVPEGDVLVHSGDFTYLGKLQAVADFANWIGSQPHKHKVVIAGNHDLTFQSNYRDIVVNLLREKGITYLEDSGCEIDNLLFYGSPWQPRFFDWAFNLDRGSPEIAQKWDMIPKDTNVLITHGPPYGILDSTTDNGSQGCGMLLERVMQLSKLKVHIFGHMHRDGGKMVEHEGVKFINAATCTDVYKPTNLPVIIDI